MKPIVMQEAVKFIKEQAQAITRVLTRAHYNLNRDFLHHLVRNDELVKERDFIYEKWLACEQALAMKTPVREAEYALDERTPLHLYDCLLPLIKENRKFSIELGAALSIDDFKAQQQVKQLEYELSKKRVPKLVEENGTMRAKIAQLEKEMSIINWYMETMESGVDTKEIVQEYAVLKRQFAVMEATTSRKIRKLGSKLKKAELQLRESFKIINRQQKKIILPLQEQLKSRNA